MYKIVSMLPVLGVHQELFTGIKYIVVNSLLNDSRLKSVLRVTVLSTRSLHCHNDQLLPEKNDPVSDSK